MSNVNIKRTVENIRASTTVYTPVVEIVVNAIQAIEDANTKKGKINIEVIRSSQLSLEGALPEVTGFLISDNGIGFTDENREAFDTLYTDIKIEKGGKGFGRFICLKYFKDVEIDSVYKQDKSFLNRTFSMGKAQDIIENEVIKDASTKQSGTNVLLRSLLEGKSFEKKLDTIARNLVEKLLPYFIAEDYSCPTITLSEQDGSNSIVLNDFVSNQLSAVIQEVPVANSTFSLESHNNSETFLVRVFKIYSPGSQKSKISLVAHKREVTGSALHTYIPEFVDDFYDSSDDDSSEQVRNYIIKAYVFSDYLDHHVSLERVGFEFSMESNLLYGISQRQIEEQVASIAKAAVEGDIEFRREKKKVRIQEYVDSEAPWHKAILDTLDVSSMPYRPSDADIETRLQQERYKQDVAVKQEIKSLLANGNVKTFMAKAAEISSRVSGSSKSELVHYIALRRSILELFRKSLEVDKSGKYQSEGAVHDIIFPRKGNTEITSFEDHNLWIIDERLNFTNYVASDLPLNGPQTERPDLLVYDIRVVFRGDNEPSNPVTVFEFKKPKRDDFVNPSSKEDPVQQIVRYVNDVRNDKYQTPEGRKIRIADATPFYGYVICDLTKKVETWLAEEKDFTQMPDGLGWFHWRRNINLYIEVLSWDKLLKDANMRNKIFFQKLGID